MVQEGDLLVQIDPAPVPGRARPSHRQAGAGPGQPHQRQAGSRAYVRAVQAGQRHAAAARPAHGQRRQPDGPGAGRPGGHRKRQGAAGLHHHQVATDRPRRLSPGRSRQHRACQRSDRHADDHPAAADLGRLHRARAAAAGHQRCAQIRPAEGDRLQLGRQEAARRGHAQAHRQPGRPGERHHPLKASFDNPDNALWPGLSVTTRLLVKTLHDVVVVPDAAVQRGPNGLYAYVVTPDIQGGAARPQGEPDRGRPGAGRAGPVARRAHRHLGSLSRAAGRPRPGPRRPGNSARP